MFEKVVIAAGLFLSILSTSVRAAEPAPSATPSAAAEPAPAPYPGYPPQAAPAPYYPPGNGFQYPPPAFGYPGYAPYAPAWQQAAYENQKRNAGLALLLEFVVPGLGSIYGDHVPGALINWGLEVVGIALIVDGINLSSSSNCYGDYCNDRTFNDSEIGLGLLMLLGGRVYGFIDAYSSTNDYNQRLRTQYGLPAWMSMQVGVQPIRSQGSVAYAPTLQLRF